VKLLLADDHKMMRDGLRAVLEKEEGVEIVGEAATGHEAIELARRLRPEIVIMDISMPDLNGVDATHRIVAEWPSAKVIVLSMSSDRRYVVAMLAAGAVGYVLKDSDSGELVQAVRAVARGHTFLSPSITGLLVGGLVESETRSRSKSERPLTTREREVLQLLAEGRSSKEIASRLAISVHTVETHRRQIMDKLSLRTIAELTKYAIREGLTSV